MYVREAASGDELDVRRILDAAVLETPDLEERLTVGDVLVAVESRGRERADTDSCSALETRPDPPEERVLGTLVLDSHWGDGAHVEAIAVRRRRKGRGIGSALVAGALARTGRLTATFDAEVLPFYESLGFEVERIDGRRFRGTTSLEDR